AAAPRPVEPDRADRPVLLVSDRRLAVEVPAGLAVPALAGLVLAEPVLAEPLLAPLVFVPLAVAAAVFAVVPLPAALLPAPFPAPPSRPYRRRRPAWPRPRAAPLPPRSRTGRRLGSRRSVTPPRRPWPPSRGPRPAPPSTTASLPASRRWWPLGCRVSWSSSLPCRCSSVVRPLRCRRPAPAAGRSPGPPDPP